MCRHSFNLEQNNNIITQQDNNITKQHNIASNITKVCSIANFSSSPFLYENTWSCSKPPLHLNQGLPPHRYKTLQFQHRMRPSISRLLVPAIYPALKDAATVQDLPRVKGVSSSLFFLTHSNPEVEVRVMLTFHYQYAEQMTHSNPETEVRVMLTFHYQYAEQMTHRNPETEVRVINVSVHYHYIWEIQ